MLSFWHLAIDNVTYRPCRQTKQARRLLNEKRQKTKTSRHEDPLAEQRELFALDPPESKREKATTLLAANEKPLNQTSEEAKGTTSSAEKENLLDPTSAEAKELCRLADEIFRSAPWKAMEETDVFGFEDPETRELGFISVMGALGEMHIIAVYRGVEALHAWTDFMDLLDVRPASDEARDRFMEIPQLQLSFEPAASLDKRDRAMIKSAGFKFGKLKPLFRSYRPGYLPWFITEAEARHLIHALEQTLVVAKQFRSNPSIIPDLYEVSDEQYLVREPRVEGSNVRWTNRYTQFPLLEHMSLTPFGIEDATINELKQKPKSAPQEIDLFTLPARIGEPHERPRLLYALLLTDSESGMVLGFEALEAVDGIDLMYASLPEKVAAMWLDFEMVPAELRGQTVRMLDIFQHLADQVGISLTLWDTLPTIDEAKHSIIQAMSQRHI